MSEAATDDQLFEREMFLDLVKDGTPLEIAAYEVGWSPKKFERIMEDDGFADMVAQHESMAYAAIEGVLYKKAMAGQQWAVQLVLYNRRPDRWKDQRSLKVETSGELAPHIIAATASAVRDSVLALVRGGNVGQLQAGNDIIDAEVIEDGGSEAEEG